MTAQSPAVRRFFAALRKTPRTWVVQRGGGWIRNSSKWDALCPLEAAANKGWAEEEPAARSFGLRGYRSIVHAADDKRDKKCRPLRDRILAACGLKKGR